MNGTTGGAATGMPGLPEVWQWQEQLVGFGTRYTGSSGHAAYVDWLAGQMSAVPGFRMRTDRLTFSRWLAREFTLTVSVPASAGRSGPVPLTYYYPYSGQTPPGGVTGRLADLGLYPLASGYTEAFWEPARGGIALVRAVPPEFSLDVAQTATGGYVPGQISAMAAIDYAAYAAALANPIFQGIFEPVPLLDAKNAGVLGVVVAWTGLPDDEVVNQYNPFTTSYPAASGLPAPGDPGCPAVWVGDSTGTELAGLAAGGQATATLVLTADITVGAATETVWGWLEGSGSTGQNIIIRARRGLTRCFAVWLPLLWYASCGGVRGIAGGEVHGAVPAPGRAAAPSADGSRGPGAGSWRDPPGGPGRRGPRGDGGAWRGRAGLRRGAAGPGPPARRGPQAGGRGGPGAAAGAAGPGRAGYAG